jgi:hypothetical protein
MAGRGISQFRILFPITASVGVPPASRRIAICSGKAKEYVSMQKNVTHLRAAAENTKRQVFH